MSRSQTKEDINKGEAILTLVIYSAFLLKAFAENSGSGMLLRVGKADRDLGFLTGQRRPKKKKKKWVGNTEK